MTSPATAPSIALAISDLSKKFGTITALDDVSFDVRRGDLHALVGGNGSGKSTLVKILADVVQADHGEIELGGVTILKGHHRSDSGEYSMHFVHQDPGLFQDMSVSDNIALGNSFITNRAARISAKAQRQRAAELMRRFEIDASPDALLGQLSATKRTMIAIARALQFTDEQSAHGSLLVLDEPTAALPEHETQQLLMRLRRLAERGQTVIYVTHRLDEILGVADRITVLRDAHHIATIDGDGVTEQQLIGLITGRALTDVFPAMPEPSQEEVLLSVEGLSSGPLHDVSFTLKRGEVLGIAGLLGSGRTTLLRTLFGDLTPSAGQVLLEDRVFPPGALTASLAAGLGYIPEDRAGESVFADLSIRENLLSASVRDYWRGAHMAASAERADARSLIKEFGIKAGGESDGLASLSGGNQQKVVLARWLSRKPRLLLLDEPTQGVDVGARSDIYHILREAVAGGMSVILVASDFEELARISDRVLVLKKGSVSAEVPGPDIDATHLEHLSLAAEMAS